MPKLHPEYAQEIKVTEAHKELARAASRARDPKFDLKEALGRAAVTAADFCSKQEKSLQITRAEKEILTHCDFYAWFSLGDESWDVSRDEEFWKGQLDLYRILAQRNAAHLDAP